ncbi:uncharacterized protein LOC111441760 [Cucurbita moschata]|uniref:Uncharacterized protein LOC111441760 n=1 Tax=Cucurbita moschata TaxID=3662 RepID=A0A6J1F3C2_CUCMO|nr:uncharacterized protein LOC111441760 [Cucurbita moschata]XP_022934628.1 uncharacterized protein LOC111441760 [Cucurbita moschata]XP_022934629.1 uncharacterized protein LOC111441760 [Cucurbita moschata]
MAESSDKPRLHFLFRCFRSSPNVQRQKAHPIASPNRRTPSLRFRFKKSSATVPLDAAVPCHDELSLSPEFNTPPPPPLIKGEIIVDSGCKTIKPSKTRKKSESTQSNPKSESTQSNSTAEKKTSPSLHSEKGLKKSISHLPTAAAALTTSLPSSDRWKPPTNSPNKKFDLVIVIVAVAIVVLWGRLCAILCTAALFYLRRCLRSKAELDVVIHGGGAFGRVSSEV